MRKFQKNVLIVLVLFGGVSAVAACKYYSTWNATQIVCAAQMETYGKTYLREYEYSVQKKVLPAYQKYFSFLRNEPFLIKATISNSHGGALEFIPSKEQKFQCQVVTKRIEQDIFPDNDFNINYAGKPDPILNLKGNISTILEGQGCDATVFKFSGEPGPTFAPGKYCSISRLTVITRTYPKT